jgi:6-phosphogluconolactonase
MKLIFLKLSIILLFASVSCGRNSGENTNDEMSLNTIYTGTYTKKEGHVNGQADGIYTLYQDPENGSLKFGATVAKIINPSFVKVSKDNKYLYAVSELGGNDAASGFIYSYKINPDHSLTETGKLSTESYAPCHIALDQTGEFVFVSNYVGGVVVVYKKKADGSLEKKQKINLDDTESSNAHSVSISANNKHAYIADLGNDKIRNFDFDAEKGRLTPNKQPFLELEKGAGPRHFTFSKDDKFGYSINELNSSISVFGINETGALRLIQNISSFPDDFTDKNSAADIHLHPSGKFLYASNRGHNSIAAFKIDENSGKLESIGTTSTLGKTPRNFAISPDGSYLYAANQDSNTISIFKIDPENGELTGHLEPLEVKTPVCIEFMN